MPGKSKELLGLLRVDTANVSKLTFSAAAYGADLEYGKVTKDQPRTILFPPLLIEE
jgi:hypothetical protein